MNTPMIAICGKRVFSQAEAGGLLPLIKKITEAAHYDVTKFSTQLESTPHSEVILRQHLENRLNEAIEKWQTKIERLGGEPQGLWIVDFDNGQGYFCWKYPEAEVGFWHGYEDGFTNRKAIQKEEASYANCHCSDQSNTW